MNKKDEALRLALEALEETRNALAWFYDSYPQDVTQRGEELLPYVETALAEIREALYEQPAQQHIEHCLWARNGNQPCPHVQPAQQQEPVATVIQFDGEKIIDASMEFFDKYPIGTELYTSPPASKPWVGLTDEEIEKGRDQTFSINNPYCPCDSKTMRKAVRWAEAKLREKNA